MENVNIKELDIKTLEFCRDLAWQFRTVQSTTGHMSEKKIARYGAFETMRSTIQEYIEKVEESKILRAE